MSETKQEIEDVVNSSAEVAKPDKSALLDNDGKNSNSISCVNCNCLLLRPNIAIFVNIEVKINLKIN